MWMTAPRVDKNKLKKGKRRSFSKAKGDFGAKSAHFRKLMQGNRGKRRIRESKAENPYNSEKGQKKEGSEV